MNDMTNVLKDINCLANELDMLYHQAARKLGLSDSALCILYMIYEKGDGCSLRELCSESGISKQTINSSLRKLEHDGILYLEQGRGKTKHIRLTQQGHALTMSTAARLYDAERRALRDWTAQELADHLRLMKKYNDCFRSQLENLENYKENT